MHHHPPVRALYLALICLVLLVGCGANREAAIPIATPLGGVATADRILEALASQFGVPAGQIRLSITQENTPTGPVQSLTLELPSGVTLRDSATNDLEALARAAGRTALDNISEGLAIGGVTVSFAQEIGAQTQRSAGPARFFFTTGQLQS